MRHLTLLAALYALIAALVVPGSIFASEEAAPETTETVAAEPAPAAPAPAPTGPAPAPAPAEPAPAPAETAPPEEQFLADERQQPEPEPKAIAAASGSVTIADFQFTPAQITIDQGDTVTWTNNGPTPHSATAPGGSFDTGIFPAGESRSHTFNEAGTFSYICTPHPDMHGTVVVSASQSGGGTPDSSSGDTGGEAAQADGGPSLPNSGADAGALFILGALMLALGVAVHRRARAEQPRPAGRIGW